MIKLEIRKIDDKPMVIHRADNKKIDHHIKRKTDLKDKLSKSISSDTDKRGISALRRASDNFGCDH